MKALLTKSARPLEVILGAVFLVAAILKVMDANAFLGQMARFGIMQETQVLAFGSLLTIFVETGIGVALILGYRQYFLSFWAMQFMLVFFAVLVFVYWPEECGCFGAYIKVGPVGTIAKNIVMLILGFAAMYGFARMENKPPARAQLLRAAASCLVALVFVGCAYPQVFREQPQQTSPVAAGLFSGYTATDAFGVEHDLGEGTYLVALLSMTCEHCMATVPELNNLALNPEQPPLVALGYEPNEESLEQFVNETAPVFPIQGIGNSFIEFSKLIDTEPPRLALIRDGHILKAWDQHMPSQEKLAKVLAEHNALQSANN